MILAEMNEEVLYSNSKHIFVAFAIT